MTESSGEFGMALNNTVKDSLGLSAPERLKEEAPLPMKAVASVIQFLLPNAWEMITSNDRGESSDLSLSEAILITADVLSVYASAMLAENPATFLMMKTSFNFGFAAARNKLVEALLDL
jgi:hypothetical protein